MLYAEEDVTRGAVVHFLPSFSQTGRLLHIFLTKFQWEEDLLLCALFNVIHVAGGPPLGSLKQKHRHWRAESTPPLFDKKKPTGMLARTRVKRHVFLVRRIKKARLIWK